MADWALDIQHLTTQIKDQTLHDELTWQVPVGEFVGLIGESGGGKTVLLRVILGLLPKKSGQIHVIGHDHQSPAVRKLWGVMFQGGALFSSLTVGENIAFPIREILNQSASASEKMAREKIDLVGLPRDVFDKYPAELSGGMTKRVALARALATEPEILFLDEPTAGLDPIGAAGLDNALHKLQQEQKLTVIMISHDLDSLNLCSKIAALVDKKIVFKTLEEIKRFDHPWVKEYFHGQRGRDS